MSSNLPKGQRNCIRISDLASKMGQVKLLYYIKWYIISIIIHHYFFDLTHFRGRWLFSRFENNKISFRTLSIFVTYFWSGVSGQSPNWNSKLKQTSKCAPTNDQCSASFLHDFACTMYLYWSHFSNYTKTVLHLVKKSTYVVV